MYLAVGQSERALQLVIFWSTPLLLVVPYDSLTLFICLSVIIQLAAVYSSCYRLHLKSHPTFVFNKIKIIVAWTCLSRICELDNNIIIFVGYNYVKFSTLPLIFLNFSRTQNHH